MIVKLTWKDGHEVRETGVARYSQQWQIDEWLVTLEYHDGSTNQYTGREAISATVEEVSGGGES